ncbi:MAG: hypothetical protein KatS3mg087_1043 [Patescibacteria group bacterium]|nr:MAG: hypothetical protein KatS3mg087_1043 [Patescibacteria group bacterium]
MYGRPYSLTASFSTTGGKTLLLVESSSSRMLLLSHLRVGNQNNNTAERWQVVVTRVTTKGTPAGTSVSAKPLRNNDAAAGLTALANLTTEPTTYEGDHLLNFGESSLVGVRWQTYPGSEILVPPSGLIGIRMLNTIATTTVVVHAIVHEVP